MSEEPRRESPTPQERAEEFAKARASGELPGEGINRRDFLGYFLMAAGGLAVGGLAGVGIGHSLAGDSPAPVATGDTVTIISEPVPGADTLVFYPRLEVAKLADISVGEPIFFEYPLVGQKAALVKLGKPGQYGLGDDADLVAFSTACTHMGWPLESTYNPDECVFGPCPGHFSTFDASVGGQVVLGQATQRLPQIVLAIEDDTVYAEGVLGLIYGYRNNLLDGTAAEATT